MKTSKSILPRLLACALVLLLALTAAVPVFAARDGGDDTNLQITIHNNTGLPNMTKEQFAVYQLFTGTPKQETNEDAGTEGEVWNPNHWNDYILADIEWGASIKEEKDQNALLAALKALKPDETDWLDSAANPFQDVTTAAQLGEVLAAHPDNKFMQGFANFLMTGKEGDSFLAPLTDLEPELNGTGAAQTLTYDLSSKGAGYYIFEDTTSPASSKAVSEYIVAVMGSQDIDLKASVPTVDKKVNGQEAVTADIGEAVTFTLNGTLPKNINDFETYTYIFHDTLSEGLTFNADTAELTVKVGETTLTAVQYQLKTASSDPGVTDGCTLEVVISDLKALAKELGIDLTVGTPITVEYKAALNENAVIGAGSTTSGIGNPNEVKLQYSNDPHETDKTTETETDTVRVYTFGLDLKKVGNDADHATGLEGASFTLQNAEGKYAKFKDGTDGKKVFDGWVAAETVNALIEKYNAAKKAWDEAKPNAQPESGEVYDTYAKAVEDLENYTISSEKGKGGEMPDVVGLDAGTYTLNEVITPAGYNTMDAFEIKIDASISGANLNSFTYTPNGGDVTTYSPSVNEGIYDSGLINETLTNIKAPFLPFTGGIGTLIFYVLGAALIAGAVTYLVIASKKRKKAEENA